MDQTRTSSLIDLQYQPMRPESKNELASLIRKEISWMMKSQHLGSEQQLREGLSGLARDMIDVTLSEIFNQQHQIKVEKEEDLFTQPDLNYVSQMASQYQQESSEQRIKQFTTAKKSQDQQKLYPEDGDSQKIEEVGARQNNPHLCLKKAIEKAEQLLKRVKKVSKKAEELEIREETMQKSIESIPSRNTSNKRSPKQLFE